MSSLIEPRVLKGFRDFLPAREIERRLVTETLEKSFRSFGFVPIDTPALEYTEILLGKGGGETEKQVYRFTDHGGRDVSLRFDLTVPFARFMAAHRASLPLPFKRYHIAKVWRGENTQRGRYREFTQCDFDIVGSDSAAADFEILVMMRESLIAIGAGAVSIRMNHRGLFNRFLTTLGVFDKSVEILRTVDKLAKIGSEETLSLLAELVGTDAAGKILDFIRPRASWGETLEAMKEAAGGPAEDSERLETLRRYMEDAGIADVFTLDPSITRGLDYYTGLVYETFLDALPAIGSVCSGGRYDNLANLYTKEKLSGIGSSIGLDRLLAALEELGMSTDRAGFAPLAIACMDSSCMGRYQKLAGLFRARGIPCAVLSEEAKPVAQYTLAEKMGAAYVLLAEKADLDEGRYTIRKLASRQNSEKLGIEDIIKLIESQT